jgi:transposase
MNSLTDLREVVDVVIGVDTHVHTHSAAVVDAATGGVLGEITVEATSDGYGELVEFANNHPMLRAWAIEGTGGHGAGLSRHLLQLSEIVIELDRPKRAARRNGAKSDPLDAIRAAREAMARPRLGTPRSGGERQALSVLLAARRSAVNASTPRPNCRCSVWSSPHPNPSGSGSVARSWPRCSTPPPRCVFSQRGTSRPPAPWWRCGPWPVARTRCSKRHASCRRRWWRSSAVGAPTCSRSSALDRSWPRRCCALGPTPAGSTAEAAFAMLAGVAPIPANSGQVTTRYRLNRYGDRQLNNALHTVVASRIQYQPATRDYVARRAAQGKTGREIKRCLARYVARDLYRLLENTPTAA